MSILVFGQAGQVARELAKLDDVVTLSRAQADLSKPGQAGQRIQEVECSAVINAAAYTQVDQVETEEDLANQINGAALAEMAQACADKGIPLVHISTDYVFDGSGDQPHRSDQPCQPVNAYGRSKRLGEIGILNSAARAVILRTSWVFSAHGNNFVKTMLRLGGERDALSVVADQIGGPTPAADIAQNCHKIALALMAGKDATGVFHYSGTPAVSWAGFAREIFKQSGLRVEVTDIASSDYPTPAARPLNSRLDCSQLADRYGIAQPDWRAGLASVVKELASD